MSASEETHRCDGHEYEHMMEYDLQEDLDRFAFPKNLDIFIDWFENADEVHADDGKHRHFTINGVEVKCNVEEESKRIRRVYWTIGAPEDSSNASPKEDLGEQ